MDETHSLLLNEQAFEACPDAKKPVFVYEWLRYLDRILPVTQRGDLKNVQKELQQQLESRLNTVTGAPTRQLLAKCIARLYVVGDSASLYNTIAACNETLRQKDDSSVQLNPKLSALSCLAALYETTGRMVGRTYEDTFISLQKWMKSAESQSRAQIMQTLTSMVRGLGSAGSTVHKDVYKMAKLAVADRAPMVKTAAIQCLAALVPVYTPLYTIELEAAYTLCVKALDGANYESRYEIAKFLSILGSTALKPPSGAVLSGKSKEVIPVKPMPVDECLNLMSAGFLRGGIGGFLKGNSGSSAVAGGAKDVRIGVAMGYVEMMREMGPTWLEKNCAVVCAHLISLAAKCGVLGFTTTPAQIAESLLLRRCVSYILRATIGSMLGENAQMTACKHLCVLLNHQINSLDYAVEPTAERNLGTEAYSSGFASTVILLELSALVRQIGSAVTPLFVEASGVMEPVFAHLLHPLANTRMATAWCLRCVAIAVPSQLTPLIDRCMSRVEHMKSSPDAISGYCLALSALVAASADCKLGIPHGKPLQVLQCAEELLKTATQQSRLAVAKIEAGWNLLYSLVSLGDAFSWQCAMVAQAGALSVMCAVAANPELSAIENTLQSMLVPIECSLVMMAQVGTLIRSYGNKMRSLNSLVRIWVYRLLLILPTKSFESCYVSLLRELVADITLSDNSQSALMSSLPLQGGGVEQVLLSPWYGTTDHAMVENLMQAHTVDLGSMEENVTSIISTSASKIEDLWPENNSIALECLDVAVMTYGKVFPLVATKHKVQITEHFNEVVKNCKQPARQQAIQLNALSATMIAFKSMCDQRSPRVENENLQRASVALVLPALSSNVPVARFMAAEALARLSQAVQSPQFVASMAQYCFDKLKTCRDAPNRAGHALALGCIHRHVGSLGTGQHLNTGISVVLALAQDTSFPSVQSWALVAMALIAETGGGMFRGFLETVLSSSLKILLTTPPSNVEVVQSVGKLLTALITCVGPELGCAGIIDGVRTSLLAACAIQLAHPDGLVKAEAIQGLQQMHLFAARYVHLSQLVVDTCSLLPSQHLAVRRAVVCCLRQLCQREAKEVHDHAQVLVPQGIVDETKKLPLPDTGLEGALFGLLDVEVQPELRSHIQETLVSLVQGTSGELLNNWLLLCKDILATTNDNTRSTLVIADDRKDKDAGTDDEEEAGGDDDTTLAGIQHGLNDKGKLLPRWPTKVFAMEIVQRVMSVCDSERAHLDLALAKELRMTSGDRSDYLVLHLSDLVRMSFMAATSDNSPLRLAGLKSLQEVINRFSSVPEPEFPGHLILEQFQAQVGAALRPAFTDDTPSHVTAAACQVCSTWIGSGVARDLNDLRRVHQLLVSSLNILKQGSINTQLYNESAATLEKLAILKAWAEVYVTAVKQEAEKFRPGHQVETDSYEDSLHSSTSLLTLVAPELEGLIPYWLAALQDSAYLSLPHPYSSQIPSSGGSFFDLESAEACREYYRTSWPPILLASATYLNTKNFELPTTATSTTTSVWRDEGNEMRFYLILAIAVEALSSRTSNFDETTIQMAVRAMSALLSCEWCQLQLMSEKQRLAVEILCVLHRLILTRDNLTTQMLCMDCAAAVVEAAREAIRVSSSRDVENGNVDDSVVRSLPSHLFTGEEGGESGDIIGFDGLKSNEDKNQEPELPKTVSFAALELCLCTIVRQMPQINGAQLRSRSLAPLHLRKIDRLPSESVMLIIRSIQLLVQVPHLCSSQAKIHVLPVIMFLLASFVKESARLDEQNFGGNTRGHLSPIAAAALQTLRALANNPPKDETLEEWKCVMRSAFYTLLLLSEEDPCRVDHCVIMLSCVVFATSAPFDVVVAHTDSFGRFIALLKKQLMSDETSVVIKTLQSITSIFSRRGYGSSFVRHLGSDVVGIIVARSSLEEMTEVDIVVLAEAFKCVETLAVNSDEKKKIQVVSLLVQTLSRLLRATSTDEWRQLGAVDRRLHEMAIGKLNAAASLWPKEFKRVVDWNAELRSKMEKALALQSSRHAMAQSARNKNASEHSTTTSMQQPKIKLMDLGALGKA